MDNVEKPESTAEVQQRARSGKVPAAMKADDRLSIQVTHLDGVAVLALQGEVDSYTAPHLRESVERVCDLGVPVVLDMGAVTFMDSTGISALVAASAIADGLSSSVQICRPSAQVLRVLALTALDTMFLHTP